MRAASGNTRLFDDRSAARTWLIFASEYVRKSHIATLFTFGVDVIAVARPAFFNTERQYIDERTMQRLELRITEIFHELARMNLGSPQAFVGVNITDTRNDGLVEERRFDVRILAAL